ncbi:hypothetical protein DPMN_035971 [Dreissena polymorpha]|uniref:EGF-like domain-containing protein n=1 Tax=Dreissena polymorpha TaxID=45954 RepID=A0A9D4MAL2_DREPO|nr:hypothetical protein DPMN_035971 [Dreissena polymorpha]
MLNTVLNLFHKCTSLHIKLLAIMTCLPLEHRWATTPLPSTSHSKQALDPAKCADVDRSNLVDGGNPGVRTANDPTNYVDCANSHLLVGIQGRTCATNPCSNGGTCTDKVNGYLCACKPEYTAPIILLDLLARLSSEKTRAIVIASSP